jgi:hypothetical protein
MIRPVAALALLAAAAAAQPALATSITAYDGLSESAQRTLVEGSLAAIAGSHGSDPAVAACIDAYGDAAPGGAGPRLEADFQSVLERSRTVAPDDFQVENLLEGLIMVECHITPTE